LFVLNALIPPVKKVNNAEPAETPSVMMFGLASTNLLMSAAKVSFTNSITGCSNNTSALTVNALPSFSLTKTDPSVCNATNGSVTIAGLTTGASYTYISTLNGVSSSPTTFTPVSPGQHTISNLGAGTYTFTIRLVSSGCTSLPQDISLNNPNAPSLNDIQDQLLCGTTYTLPAITGTNLPGEANQSYRTAPNGGGTAIPVGTVISTIGVTTIYIWTQTPTTGGCSDQETFTVTINSNPVVTAPTSVCVEGIGQLTPTTGVTWTSSNDLFATVTNGLNVFVPLNGVKTDFHFDLPLTLMLNLNVISS
jgi:hypothetical protein